jgi:hypothetical protein
VPTVQIGYVRALVGGARQPDGKHHVAIHHLDDVACDMPGIWKKCADTNLFVYRRREFQNAFHAVPYFFAEAKFLLFFD